VEKLYLGLGYVCIPHHPTFHQYLQQSVDTSKWKGCRRRDYMQAIPALLNDHATPSAYCIGWLYDILPGGFTRQPEAHQFALQLYPSL
jgi:hypothetical protein